MKLDNPAWHSLQETHQKFSLTFDSLKCYHPDHCPFGGYENNNSIPGQLDEYSKLTRDFFIIGEKPVFSNALMLQKELVCLQMVLDRKIELDIQEEIVPLKNGFDDALIELVTLVQPGYFKRKTIQLGDYYGIFKNERLVAATGERMKMNGFTEVSAIVTHPHHTGKGYARQLIAHTVNQIIGQGKAPYLHVAETNAGAISLYDKLGFRTRRKISFWHFKTR